MQPYISYVPQQVMTLIYRSDEFESSFEDVYIFELLVQQLHVQMHLGNLSCQAGSMCLRKEGRPFLSRGGEQFFTSSFSHSTKQLLSRLPLSASGASSCSVLGAVPYCCFLPWDTVHEDADIREFPFSASGVLISITLQTGPCWIPFPLLQWYCLHSAMLSAHHTVALNRIGGGKLQ